MEGLFSLFSGHKVQPGAPRGRDEWTERSGEEGVSRQRMTGSSFRHHQKHPTFQFSHVPFFHPTGSPPPAAAAAHRVHTSTFLIWVQITSRRPAGDG